MNVVDTRDHLLRVGKRIVTVSGLLFVFFVFLSFTDIPYYAYHYLGTCNSKVYYKPDIIVVMGGAGMPSQDGLIRSYYAAEAAHDFPTARIVIALPYEEEEGPLQPRMMAHELVIRGVDSSRISFEGKGFNTHTQAENIAGFFGNSSAKMSVLLVTSPEHMYRSVKAFSKQGFAHVCGHASFERPINEEEVTDTDRRTDTRIKNLNVRYNMWNYMNYELLVLKEYAAITYYKLKGWI